MDLLYTHKELISWKLQAKSKDLKVGFVPTMGALHQGHLSLIQAATENCDLVIASIFVNPLQFNNKEDLEKYPRTLDSDLTLLKSVDCDAVFIPTYEEIYPEPTSEVFDLGGLDKMMEGFFRPGHFNGVAIVVKRLFELVEPNQAFFGMKDFQQLTVIKHLVESQKMNIEIIGCPILREANGLAMSSRNIRLSEQERIDAAFIFNMLEGAKKMSHDRSVKDVSDFLKKSLSNSFLKLEYAEIVDTKTLLPITNWEDAKNVIICIAVWCGEVRLIDNIQIK